MYRAKGLFGPPSLIYKQGRFTPCFDISLLPPTQIMLGAHFIHCVNKSAFAYLLRDRWPFMALESPSPSSLGACFIHCVNKSAFGGCRDSRIAKTTSMINAWYKGKDIRKKCAGTPILSNCSKNVRFSTKP